MGQPVSVPGVEWVGVLVALIEVAIEAAEDGGHGQVELAVTVQGIGINQRGGAFGGEEVISRPEVAVK